MVMKVQKTIARAIKNADRSYFFENYDKQAAAVLRVLEKEGYVIVPVKPDPEILKKAADTMATGKMKPEEHVLDVHQKLSQLLKA